ncbi:MAG: hypothetical protein ISS72_11190 [Candidatus Brocadiae bacterium]|nr:hypothetical protein [Candidatus Brocadiia bacterium]
MTPKAGAVPFLGSAEVLRAAYEDLRHGVLCPGDGARSLGEALLVSRGMAAWTRAWAEIRPPKEKTRREASDRNRVLPVAGRGEIATILAHMALGAREED